MALRGEVKLSGLLAEDIFNTAAGEVDGLAAIGANEVVVVSGVADLIVKIAVVQEHAADEAQLDHQLHIPVDRGPAELGQLRAQLLGGEVVGPSRDCLDDRASGLGHPVTSVLQRLNEVFDEGVSRQRHCLVFRSRIGRRHEIPYQQYGILATPVGTVKWIRQC